MPFFAHSTPAGVWVQNLSISQKALSDGLSYSYFVPKIEIPTSSHKARLLTKSQMEVVRPPRQLLLLEEASLSHVMAGLTFLRALRSGDRPQKEAPGCDDVCMEECNPHAAAQQSLFGGMASPRVPDSWTASTAARPWGSRCEPEAQERWQMGCKTGLAPDALHLAHSCSSGGGHQRFYP